MDLPFASGTFGVNGRQPEIYANVSQLTIHQVFTSVHIEPPASNRRRALEFLSPRAFLPVGVRENKRPFPDLDDAYIRHRSRPQTSQFNPEIEHARRPHCDPFNRLIQAQPQGQELGGSGDQIKSGSVYTRGCEVATDRVGDEILL